MSEVKLSSIVDLLAKMRQTNSKNEKVSLAASFLMTVPSDQLADTAHLMIGQILSAESGSPGIQFSDIANLESVSQQSTLFSEPLTVSRVAHAFEEIHSISGSRSRQRKTAVLRGLMLDASNAEIEFLLGCITGDMRAGFSEGLLIEAIAKTAGKEPREVVEAFGIIGDIGRVAEGLLGEGKIAERATIFPMKPIRLMLAESAEDVAEAMEIMGTSVSLEYKLDGIRVQIHRDETGTKIFSRRPTDVTAAIPEIVDAVKSVKGKSFILDGEVIAFKKKPLPFQEVMRRVTRETGIADEAKETPLKLFLFDVIFLDGRNLMDQSYEHRARILSEIAPPDLIVPRLTTASNEEALAFMKKSLAEGHEGLIVKNPNGYYHLGKRSRDWIKVKEYVTIDAAIIAAEWGHGRRSKWLSNYHLGVRNPDGFSMVGKTFKGLTDSEFVEVTRRLTSAVTKDYGHWVKVKPQIVVEVAFNEVQKSPKYASGMALRFARVIRIRDDKGPDEITTEDELRGIMEKQFTSKARRMK